MSDSLQWVQYACYGINSSIILLTLLRFYVRKCITDAVGFDDWSILFSVSLLLGSSITIRFMFQAGIGLHASNLSDDQTSSLSKILLSLQILYYFAIGSVKISIIAIARRIKPSESSVTSNKPLFEPVVDFADVLSFLAQVLKYLINFFNRHRYNIFGGYIVIYTAVASIETHHLCSPTTMISGTLGDLRCNTLNWVNAGLQSSTDALLVVLLLAPIWTLKLSIEQKRRVVVFFSLGLFNVVMAILRARWSHIAFTNPDFSWHWALPVLWMTSEIAVAHICATVSVITMPLLRKCTGTATVSGCQQRNKSESSTPVGKYGSEVELLPRPI